MAFTLRAAALWQFAPSKLLRAQKIAGAIFNREATPRAKCMDALGKEKVTKKAARERSCARGICESMRFKGHPTFWFLLRKNSLPQAPWMARMQKLQEQFSVEAILRVAVA